MMNAATLVASAMNGGTGHHLPPLSTESISSMVGWISIWVWVCVYSPCVLMIGNPAHPYVVFLTHFLAYSFF